MSRRSPTTGRRYVATGSGDSAVKSRKPRVTSEPKLTRPSGFPRHTNAVPCRTEQPRWQALHVICLFRTADRTPLPVGETPILLRGPSSPHPLFPLRFQDSLAGTTCTTRDTLPEKSPISKPELRYQTLIPSIGVLFHLFPHGEITYQRFSRRFSTELHARDASDRPLFTPSRTSSGHVGANYEVVTRSSQRPCA